MRRYIRAELDRNLLRPYFLLMTLIVTGFAVALNVVGSRFGGEMYVDYSIQMLPAFFGLPIFLIIMIVDMVSMEEFKNGTIKNIVSSGLSREKIVISKIVVSCILGLIAAFVVMGTYLLSANILMGTPPNIEAGVLYRGLMYMLIGVVPLWLGCVGVCTFFTTLIDKSFVSGFIYYIYISIVPGILGFANVLTGKAIFGEINKYMINPTLEGIGSGTVDFQKGILIGLGHLLIFGLLSVLVFKKRDI